MPDVDRRTLIASLEAEGLTVTEWTDDAGTSYAAHAHGRREVRVVLEGSMTIAIDGVARRLGPGERLDIEAGRLHEATIGPEGVRYLAGAVRSERMADGR
jgi:quercetin dioxygenase-like cupin family protein